MSRVPIFDLDGTLLDSDRALLDPFVRFGVAREDVVFGEPLGDACDRLGISIDDYLQAYDVSSAMPFPGVEELIASLTRWAICSNKYGIGALKELERLGWQPDVSLFSEDFDYRPKRLEVVLEALDVGPEQAIFVGDTIGDRDCAAAAGVTFALAAWNPRARGLTADVELREPGDLIDLLERAS